MIPYPHWHRAHAGSICGAVIHANFLVTVFSVAPRWKHRLMTRRGLSSLANWRTHEYATIGSRSTVQFSERVNKWSADPIGFSQFGSSTRRSHSRRAARGFPSRYSRQLRVTIRGIMPVCQLKMRYVRGMKERKTENERDGEKEREIDRIREEEANPSEVY